MSAYEDELEQFCRREHPRLVGTLTLYTGDPQLASDLAQEALARVCRDWSSVTTLGAPGAWAHRVAINLAKSTFRRRAVERRHRNTSTGSPVDEPPDVAAAIALRDAVAQLPHRQRAALILRYWGDFSVEDTAEAMRCATGTVKALTHQAIATLRRAGFGIDDDLVDGAAGDADEEVNDLDAPTR